MLHERSGAIESNLLAVVDVEDDVVLDRVIDEIANHLQADGDTDAVIRGTLSDQDGI